jgi:hypothetical protein
LLLLLPRQAMAAGIVAGFAFGGRDKRFAPVVSQSKQSGGVLRIGGLLHVALARSCLLPQRLYQPRRDALGSYCLRRKQQRRLEHWA